MTHANPVAHNLGPYVLAFVAGAVALSGNDKTSDAERAQPDENAKARAAILDKLLDRLALLYRAPRTSNLRVR